MKALCRAGIVLLLFSLCGVFPSPSSGADPVVEKIRKAYEGIKDLKGSFVQRSVLKDLGRTDTFKGTFVIAMPSRMRWQYRGEDTQQQTEVIINGEEMIIYQKKEKQAFRGRFDRETYGQAPIALLSGLGNLEKEFEISVKNGRLILKPKKPMGSVVSIDILPSDGAFPIASLGITDRHGNKVDITFRDVSVNAGVADSAFDFTLPKGASMYENK